MRTVTIETSAMEAIRAETTIGSASLETGGILLGHVAKDGVPLHIILAGGPGPQALHELRRFRRDLAYAQTLADQAWADHQAVWIGEWHTHPTTGLLPSTIDLQSYLRHLADPELHFDEFLSLIVASVDVGPAVAAWIITRTELVEAHLIVTGEVQQTEKEGT